MEEGLDNLKWPDILVFVQNFREIPALKKAEAEGCPLTVCGPGATKATKRQFSLVAVPSQAKPKQAKSHLGKFVTNIVALDKFCNSVQD